MSLCTGGSEPKAGVTDTYALTFDYMGSILPPGLVWLKPFLPYIRPIFLDSITSYCGTEPALPDLTGITIAAVLAGGEFGAAIVAAEAITQLVLYYAWFELCQCVTGGPPTPASPPSAPSDLPVVGGPAPLVGPCQQQTLTHTQTTGSFDSHNLPALTGTAPITAGFTATLSGDLTCSSTVQLNTVSTAGVTTQLIARSIGNGFASNTVTVPQLTVPVGTDHLNLVVTAAGTAGHTCTVDTDVTVFCGGSGPSTTVQPCCPPDPIATGYLSQILNLVTLIQRQAVPFAYVPGSVHSSLSGAGHVDISGLLGVKVDITTLPDSYGRQGTFPTEYFDLGFITFGTADGWPTSFRLERDAQLCLPARASVYTDLDYDLAPGVVVTITELSREP